jgi:type II restriction/modification system DNA methylase subunit YeeA
MRDGGFFGPDVIRWFNGGLFDDAATIRLEFGDLEILADTAANHVWSEIDPSIFGTLFEQALKATRQRRALGAHYTDREKILKIVDPVIVRPLTTEWDVVKAEIGTLMAEARELERKSRDIGAEARRHLDAAAATASEAADILGGAGVDSKALGRIRAEQRKIEADASAKRISARQALEAFQQRLANFRVLDPACGSGNFLYVALHALRDIEQKAVLDASLMGLPAPPLQVGVDTVRGIEIEPYAAELARVTLWIGNLQWLIRRGYRDTLRDPLLAKLDQIECRDAVLNPDGNEAEWPKVDVIIGNPPFLGDRKQKKELGLQYVNKLRNAYGDRVPGRADFVVYWLQRAVESLLNGSTTAFGLVATKSVAKGASRCALDFLREKSPKALFDAWTNERWVLKGALVRVAMVCARSPDPTDPPGARLNGNAVSQINPDLTSGLDVTRSKPLRENRGISFQGVKLTGPFDLAGDEARRLLIEAPNPNGRTNADVLRRLYDIDDVVGRDSDRWVVDFGSGLSERDAALYEAPFQLVVQRVVPFRADPEQCRSTEVRLREVYWEFQRPRPKLRRAIAGLSRFLVTPESSEHRVFRFVPGSVLVQGSLFAIARDDYMMLGLLSSSLHETWSTRQGNRLGVGNQRRYNVGVTFETFPFPEGLAPNVSSAGYSHDPRAVAIGEAARRLDDLREAWLNPPDLVVRTPEVRSGYPDRLLPKDEEAEIVLKRRTLTRLYNERPAWLDIAHHELDAAVAAAYGWPIGLSDDEVLARLFALNQERLPADG